MSDIDQLLHEAGERWRASQQKPPEIDPSALAARPARSSPAALFLAGVIGAILMLVIGVAALQLSVSPGVGGLGPGAPTVPPVEPSRSNTSPSPSLSRSPSSGNGCEPTRPNPILVPPPTYPASPPAYYQAAWYGSAALWTMLDHEGEVWAQSGLPHGPDGLGQKTFWWSADWSVDAEPMPPITVTGTRLDGPGSFTAGPGTNASADFGTAMLVGIEIPAPGCWQLTGRYRDAALSYVVWITDE